MTGYYIIWLISSVNWPQTTYVFLFGFSNVIDRTFNFNTHSVVFFDFVEMSLWISYIMRSFSDAACSCTNYAIYSRRQCDESIPKSETMTNRIINDECWPNSTTQRPSDKLYVETATQVQQLGLHLMSSSHRRHRQDKTVLSCRCRRCELNWRQSQTVFSSPQYIGDWTSSSSSSYTIYNAPITN